MPNSAYLTSVFILLLFLQLPANAQTFSQTPSPKTGRYLAIASDCVACHTAPGGKNFAGGLAMPLPMGNIYSTNITPDKNHGIGNYTLDMFKRVLREGIRGDGANLYPAMPYPSYTKLSDEDIALLYDYFMHEVEPIPQENRHTDFKWPLTLRWPLGLWNIAFLDKGEYRQNPDKSQQWNRGAYLVQGAAHCGTCHTPRGMGMQEKAYSETESGYLSGAQLAGWTAFNITPDQRSGIGIWGNRQVVQYLKSGNVPGKAQASGQMAEAITHSFSKLTDYDLEAMTEYLSSIPAVNDTEQNAPRSGAGKPSANLQLLRNAKWTGTPPAKGVGLYINHCASCHGKEGTGTSDGYYPSLFKNSVVGAQDTNNLIQAILHGAEVNNGKTHYFMPAFDNELDDNQVVTLVKYITHTYGYHESDITTKQVHSLRHQN